MKMFNLVAVKGKETFGISLWADDIKKAMSKARRMLMDAGYAIHPA